jgi:alpha-galactosidase
VQILDQVNGLESYAGPGHWNDPDMLEVGNGGLNENEAKAHFSLWCILAAPLMAGNDLRNMSPAIRDILTNKELIAVDQDPLGRQGRRVQSEGELDVWAKQLADGGRAVALLNRSEAPAKITASWTSLGYPAALGASVRDLWAGKDLGVSTESYSAEVPSHGVVVVRVMPVSGNTPAK